MTSPNSIGRTGSAIAVLLVMTAAVSFTALGAEDGVTVAILPASLSLDAGDTFTVELAVAVEGEAFNAFDLYVSYDRDALTFLQMPDLSDQIGPLMSEACGVWPFHLFSVSSDSMLLTVNFSLMCPQTSVTGPGVIYRLEFECKHEDFDTWIGFYRAAPGASTSFYYDGLYVKPVLMQNSHVRIGAGTPVHETPGSMPPRLHVAPNPFNPRTTVFVVLAEPQPVRLRVYACDGRLVTTLCDGILPAGRNAIPWTGRDERGGMVASGVYTVQLRTAGGVEAKKMSLLR